MAVPPIVSKLVETFDRNIDNFKSQTYNETQVRQQFINPFFEALGWDMQNKAGIALAYSDVIHEDAIKVGGSTKAPDYCFRIGGTRKFFLEAKKPSVDIKSDVSPAYQLRRYAWSAKLPLSILTDFEEFAVYDCQIRPNVNDKPSTARIFFCGYKEYGDKWEQIANIFSKEAVLKGLFDKYASEKTSKRGTTTVDKEFLAEIEGWRDELAKNIALRNSKLSVYDLNFAVQKTIDRILFLRICEDRGIERSEQLLGLINGSRIYPRLFELFEESDERYNSGIFHFRREKDRPESPDELSANLKVDDDVLKKILKDLYYPHSPYEFSVMPAEILGNVYEQFLGKVIRLTASHQAKVEEKPEVKKAGGVYYTPSYIVDYIVKNTVGKLCENKTPKQIEKLKILDPACGSGSFLIGAYQYLLDFHRDYYAKEPSKHKKQIYQGKGGQWFLTIDEKKRILLNNIYGVDIDSQAVEVTKLSLLLKVLENETQETLRLFHERALPDLGNNIKCGNSLIGTDFYTNQQLDLFNDEQKRKINAFDWQTGFPEIFKLGGFDAVIGNPPYVQVLQSEHDEELNYFAENYVSTSAFKKNLFPVFIERCLGLIRQDGAKFSMIIPDRFFFTPSYIPCRQKVLKIAKLEVVREILAGAFENAIVGNAIFFLSTPCEKSYRINIEQWSDNKVTLINQIPVKDVLSDPQAIVNLLTNQRASWILNKCQKSSSLLKDIISVHVGIMIKENKKLFSESRIGAEQKKIVKGKQFARYFLRNTYFFDPKKAKVFGGTKNPQKHEQTPKILMRKTGNQLVAYIDTDGIYAEQSVYLLLPKSETNLWFVLGILNSKLLSYLFQNCFITNPVAYPYIQHYDVEKLPVRTIDNSNRTDKAKHDKMVSLVERMLDLNKKLNAATVPDEKTRIQREITATDGQIDKLVYELYGLTEEEIRIVEGISNV
jgi:type I restriction-modification system DNA methylase subunit